MSSRSEFDKFKSSINPVSVIQSYVELRKNGSQWVGRCPFHEDGSPSLTVNERGWICFGCNAKGDAVRFVQDIEGIGFLDAYKKLRLENGFTPGEIKPQLRERVQRAKAEPLSVNSGRHPGKVVAAYDYTDEHGKLLFQVVRMEPGRNGKKKDFLQRRPDGQGGWIWKVRDGEQDLVRHVLYRLPRIIPAREVYIACGEKDVHTLESMGLIATTNPGGEGKWRKEYNKHLEGKAVYVCPDNDTTGMKHAELLQRELRGICKSFSICTVLL
jgi:DNA primase